MSNGKFILLLSVIAAALIRLIVVPREERAGEEVRRGLLERAARARCCLDSRRGDPSREILIAAPARLGYNPHCVSHVRRPRAPDHPKRIALLALIHLARQPKGEYVSVPSIAESRDIPAKFLEQILLTLKRARTSEPAGQRGGYTWRAPRARSPWRRSSASSTGRSPRPSR